MYRLALVVANLIYLFSPTLAGPYQTSWVVLTVGKTTLVNFNVLVDTVNNETWVLGSSAPKLPGQAQFTGSTGWTSQESLNYRYAGQTVQGTLGCCGTLSAAGKSAQNIKWGTSTTGNLYYWGVNNSVTLSGSFSIGRTSPFVVQAKVLNLIGGSLSFGNIVGGGGFNTSMSLMSTLNVPNSNIWATAVDLMTISTSKTSNLFSGGGIYLVIDAGNPNIEFEAIDGPFNTQLNTLVTNADIQTISFTMNNISHVVKQTDFKIGKTELLRVSPSSTLIPTAKLVVRVGYAFLKGRQISLVSNDVNNQSLVIATPLPPPPPPPKKAQWVTIVIIAVLSFAFAAAFIIGANYYCSLPPETEQRPTEQQPFLGGQQARSGQYSRIGSEPRSANDNPPNNPAAFSGLSSSSGSPNVASNAASVNSAPAQQQQPSAAPARGSGQVLGGTGARDAESMRNQRLAAMERNLQPTSQDGSENV